MIELDQLTKRYGHTTAVDHLTFAVQPGIVTGYLGPNGAGKSTTMRLRLGLEQPTSGTALVNGRSYRDHATPIHEIGVRLEAKATHPGRSAREHLLAMASTHGLSVRRVDEVLGLVGLSGVATRRCPPHRTCSHPPPVPGSSSPGSSSHSWPPPSSCADGQPDRGAQHSMLPGPPRATVTDHTHLRRTPTMLSASTRRTLLQPAGASQPLLKPVGRGERRDLAVKGALVRYWDYGAQHTGRTLVMVHGFRGDHHGLEQLTGQFAGERVVVPDLPGFGASAPFQESAHTVAAYADWLNSFVAQLPHAGEVVVLGHSFGSVVVAAALAAGSSASRAVLVNPIGAALSGPRAVLSRLVSVYYQLGGALPERAGAALLRSRMVIRVMSALLTTTRDPELRRWILTEHLRHFNVFADRQSLLEAFAASVGDDVSAYAAQITIPVLLVGGDRDDITPVVVQQRLASRFRNATLVVLPDVGHLIHYETPGQAAQAIAAFLQETDR